MKKFVFVYYCLVIATLTAEALKTCSSGSQAGRDGRDGINGRDGLNGCNGKDGVDGKNGIGVNGKDGRDGQNAVRNWKQCAWKNVNEGKDNGVIKACSFKKNSANTHLKIVGSTNMRLDNCDRCCKRWYITINGKECQDPVPIDVLVYMKKGINREPIRNTVITGVCNITRSGTFNIALNVGNCHGYTTVDALTGWNSSTSIYIEELDPPQA